VNSSSTWFETFVLIVDWSAAVVRTQVDPVARAHRSGAFSREFIMTKRTLIATAATLFAASTIATAAFAADDVHCGGINACKGQSACKGASNACKGQNACKGTGWTAATNAQDCTAKGGKVL
jgi:hypothetical protein